MLKRNSPGALYTLKPTDLKLSLGSQVNIEPDPDAVEQLGVLCINCGEYIFCLEIEAHSAKCTNVQPSELESDQGLKQVKLKLTKLEAFLGRALASYKRPGDLNYLKILGRLCAKIQPVKAAEDLRLISQVAESVASLLTTYRGKDTLKLYGERLKALVSELESEVTAISLKSAVDSLKQEVEFYKHKASRLESSMMSSKTSFESELTKVFIDNLDSEVGSRNGDTSELSSLTSQSDRRESFESICQENSQDVPVDLKRYFYSQCLGIKLTFPNRSLAHKVPISSLYRQVVNQQVPLDSWPEYIKAKLEAAADSTRPSKVPVHITHMSTLHEASEDESDKEY